MTTYLNGVFLLNFLVDFFLLLGAGRLCACPVKWYRAALGALLGGIYSAVCLFPGFSFLGNLLWRMVSLVAMAVIAYGLIRSALRGALVYALLSFALGGVVMGMGKGGAVSILSGAGVLFLLCFFGFRGKNLVSDYVPVELYYGQRRCIITALRDTGNMLRDPVTGQQVLVIGADVAARLTGLTRQQLRQPVESMGALPGLRLIPYRSVGCSNGFLLALRLPRMKIGTWQGSGLVAFAPEDFSPEGSYQALIGGVA